MKAGDRVDDWSATDQTGRQVKLSELLAEGPLVLFFYPKAMTPG
jgi:peroxiredoxin Q/BCP